MYATHLDCKVEDMPLGLGKHGSKVFRATLTLTFVAAQQL